MENQRKFILPYNDISKNIFYDQRLGITPPLDTPVMWKVSKVEGINPLGVMIYTAVQDLYNPNTDVIEYDLDGNWKGVWADLISDGNLPLNADTDPEAPPIEDDKNYAEITYTGSKPQIKINGGYKSITITYYNSGELIKDQTPGEWSYFIDDTDISDLIQTLETASPNTIKIKFLGDENYLHKVIVVKNTRSDVIAELGLELISL